MSRTHPQLLASCWTSAGDVMPARGPDYSPIPIRTRIEAVAAAGYVGFGLTRPDLVRARDSIGLTTLAEVLRDNGIRYVQLEWLTDWWTSGAAREASDRVRADLFEAAPIQGVDHIKVGADDNGVPVEYAVLCEGFDRLADDAKSAGVRIAFENTPFTHHVKTTEDAVALVTQVGNPNGGLLLDIWHAYRGGTPYAKLPALVPPEIVFGVELDDGRAEPVGTDLEDTFDNRLPCGTGVFGVPAFINAVLAIGWSGPWGIEHMSRDFRRLPVRDALTRARDAALRCFDLAARNRSGDPNRAVR
jgi:sugar phosphate isomerase/epimerase